MGSISNKISNLRDFFSKVKSLMFWTIRAFPKNDRFGHIGKNSIIAKPVNISNPKGFYIEEQVKIRYGFSVINSKTEKVIVKKYSVLAPMCTIITNSHRSTVGIPQFLLGESHVNDKSGDVIINEDVWVGAQTTIMAGVSIGRGLIIGARALVTKDVPPYALVVGMPAKIVGVKFSKSGILEHERVLYPEHERMTETEIDNLFETYYSDKKIFGCEGPLTNEQTEAIERVKQHRLN